MSAGGQQLPELDSFKHTKVSDLQQTARYRGRESAKRPSFNSCKEASNVDPCNPEVSYPYSGTHDLADLKRGEVAERSSGSLHGMRCSAKRKSRPGDTLEIKFARMYCRAAYSTFAYVQICKISHVPRRETKFCRSCNVATASTNFLSLSVTGTSHCKTAEQA